MINILVYTLLGIGMTINFGAIIICILAIIQTDYIVHKSQVKDNCHEYITGDINEFIELFHKITWCKYQSNIFPESLFNHENKSQLHNTLREGSVFRNYEKNISFKAVSPDFLIKNDE